MTPRIVDFVRFITARHLIYLKRRAGIKGPWTEDPVLSTGRFCNVFRELDRVTIWIEENIRKPFANHPNLWFMLAIARYINWPDTLQELIEHYPDAWPDQDSFSLQMLTEALEDRARRGEKVYTGAYLIRAESNSNADWYSWSKHRYIAEIVLGRLWENRRVWEKLLTPEPCPGNPGMTLPSLEMVWDEFQNPYYIGWGPFMAYEVVTDLRHTRYLRDTPDIYTWANAGPGAIRGLNRMLGRDLSVKPKPEQTCREMMDLMIELNDWDSERVNDVFGLPCDVNPRFEMRDIEHCLCEFDKYERVRLGEGKMRSKYNWKTANPL